MSAERWNRRFTLCRTFARRWASVAGCIAALSFDPFLHGCGSSGSGTKVTSELVSDSDSCFISGEVRSESPCLVLTTFHFFLSDGTETKRSTLGPGGFRELICRGETPFVVGPPPTSCPAGLNVTCSEIVRYETTTDDSCDIGVP